MSRSFGYENYRSRSVGIRVVMDELGVEVDGDGVGEAAFGGGGGRVAEREGEDVEAVGEWAQCAEQDGASGLHEQNGMLLLLAACG